jgi:hypothetical protein
MKVHLLHVVLVLAAIAGFSAATMLLWNGLLPQIFGIATIGFWQAMGLLVLAKILFGSAVGHRRNHIHEKWHGKRNALREKWMGMTPEQRKIFIGKHNHCSRHFHLFDEYLAGSPGEQTPNNADE